MNKNDNLEIIRGLAALVVVLCHIIGKIPIPIFQKSVLFSLLGNWGTEAVIIFFVLSGIVIGISQEAKPKDRSAFIKNRLLRIIPIFLIGFLLSLIANILYHHSLPSISVMLGSLFFVSTLQGWIVEPLEFNPVIWSLSFEMFFYLIFSLTINNKKVALILWCLLSVLCIPLYYTASITSGIAKHFIAMFAFSSIWLVGYFIQKNKHRFCFNFVNALFSLFTLPLVSRLSITADHYDVIKYLIFAFLSVPLFGYILKPVRLKFNNALGLQISITLILITFLHFYSESSAYNKLIYSALPFAAFLVLGFKNFFVRVYAVVSPSLVFLGGISYSLYVLHYPIIFLTLFFLTNYLFLVILISLPSVFLVCIFLEKIYQKRIMSFIRR
ncbi:MAG TPA: acyltransferase [Cyclobacteriaceae bacterium]|jgi:peptidoglycan/LPS O-acetylase OafA/YrhL|nr:acyltransferase [Cyclobacteriaceae bacterium]